MKNLNIKSRKVFDIKFTTLIVVVTLTISGCKKFIEVNPPIQSISANDVYKSNTTAAAVITGIYMDMASSSIFTGQSSISLRTGLSADELTPVTDPNSFLTVLYKNALTTDEGGFWINSYIYIFKVNDAIKGISASSTITPAVKQQLLGEAKFLRAFFYFYLVNLFGDVPLLMTLDIKINSTPSRIQKSLVYDQIMKDLKEAQADLNENYVGGDVVSPSNVRVRPNKAVATALLARVYLYTKQWSLAEIESTKLISNAGVYKLENLDNAFLSSTKEAIWQLQPIDLAIKNTFEGSTFVLALNYGVEGPDANGRPVFLSKQIYNSFEIGDNRKIKWVDSVKVDGVTYPYAFKYKQYTIDAPQTEYLVVFRLGEQYLIRAEARAEQGKVTGLGSAAEDLNAIRIRAGLGINLANAQSTILNAIYKERKVELFTEWGHRWMDLKRTATIDEVMSFVAPTKGTTWSSYKSLYPIPVSDILRNPNLKGHQNPGYPEQ